MQLARLPAKVWDALRQQGQGDPARKPVDAATRTYLATADAAQRRRGKPRSSGEPVRQPPSAGPPGAWTPAWDVAWTRNRTIYTADRLPVRAASSARDRHCPANVSSSSA